MCRVFGERVGMRVQSGAAREVGVERVGERVDRLPRYLAQFAYLVVAKVEYDVVDLEVARQYVAVVGQYVAAFRGDRGHSGEFAFRAGVPRPGIDDRGLKEFVYNSE